MSAYGALYVGLRHSGIGLHCKKGYRFLFPPRESLVSDIPAGDGKIANLFYSERVSVESLVLRSKQRPSVVTEGELGRQLM